MRGRVGDMVVAGFLIILAAAMFLATLDFPDPGQPTDPGTAMFPQIIAGTLAALAVLLLLRPEQVSLLPPRSGLVRVAAILGLTIAYALLLEPVGFLLATVAFMVAALLLMAVRRPVPLVLTAVGVPLAVFYVFAGALRVHLPSGVIERMLL